MLSRAKIAAVRTVFATKNSPKDLLCDRGSAPDHARTAAFQTPIVSHSYYSSVFGASTQSTSGTSTRSPRTHYQKSAQIMFFFNLPAVPIAIVLMCNVGLSYVVVICRFLIVPFSNDVCQSLSCCRLVNFLCTKCHSAHA